MSRKTNILFIILTLVMSFWASNVLDTLTHGLWSVAAGAPWPAILVVYIIPVALCFVFNNEHIFIRLCLSIGIPIVVAIVDLLVCVIIGMTY